MEIKIKVWNKEIFSFGFLEPHYEEEWFAYIDINFILFSFAIWDWTGAFCISFSFFPMWRRIQKPFEWIWQNGKLIKKNERR